MFSMLKKKQLKKQSKDEKPEVESDELFVLKTKWRKETTKKTIEIHDFILKIEDENKNLKIVSPKFKLGGREFSIAVYPNCIGAIAVFLQNYHSEAQIISIKVRETSGLERSREMVQIPGGIMGICGIFMLLSLSHQNYRELAKVNGDVLRLEVEVTLHIKAEGDDWTR